MRWAAGRQQQRGGDYARKRAPAAKLDAASTGCCYFQPPYSRLYHRSGCPGYSRTAAANRVAFADEAAA